MKHLNLIRTVWTGLLLALTALADTNATLNVGQSISFDTFTVGSSGDMTFTGQSTPITGGPPPPAITNIQNNSSNVPAGFPNYGIAPSSLFVVIGTNMADPGTITLQDSTQGLPTTLNGASLSVTVNGVTTQPALYYAVDTRIAAVLPAATPVGTGTLTVNYKGAMSAAVPIQVIASAPGLTTYSGSVVAQVANTVPILTYTNAAQPGDIIILWGTGLGADSSDSDTTYTPTPHPIATPLQVYIGGIQVTNIAYQGASVYPGVDVLGLTIPQNVPTGCSVPVAVVAGNVVSNIGTLPIATGGGMCTDPRSGFSGNQFSMAQGQPTINTGILTVSQPASGGGGNVFGSFTQTSGAGYSANLSPGACLLTQNPPGAALGSPATALDAGDITVTAPGGAPMAVTENSIGNYGLALPAGTIPSGGGVFTFHGAGGAQIGSFTAAVSFPNPPLNWTNQSAAAAVTRTQGLTINWTGGNAGTYVNISGSSSDGNVGGSFSCVAPVSAESFIVPAYILNALPAGNGPTNVVNITGFTPFTATGLTFGTSYGLASYSTNSTYH